MDESWLDEAHPDKTKMKFSDDFGLGFLVFFLYALEYQIRVLGLLLTFKIFQARSLTTVANSCLN